MKKHNIVKKFFALALAGTMALSLAACGKESGGKNAYKIGICNYVDDASLNQINENIQARLKEIGDEKGVSFEIDYENPNADATVMNQVIANFQALLNVG